MLKIEGVEPTGNLVDAPTKFFVETFSAGNGEVDIVILNPKGQKEPVSFVRMKKMIFVSIKIEFKNPISSVFMQALG